MAITKIVARTVYDSRGNPTVQVSLWDNNGEHIATVPSGASTGTHEAHELRDGDKAKWGGKGVTKAVENVNKVLGPELIKSGLKVTDQAAVDALLNKLDGTDNKQNLGANAILAVGMAVLVAGAAAKRIPVYAHVSDLSGTKKPYVLPVPFFNVINGGAHGGGFMPFQEFMVVPVSAPNFAEAMRWGSEVYAQLKSIAKKQYGPTAGNVGDEGGIAPPVAKPEEALDLIMEAIKKAGHEGKMKIALDVAASEFYSAEERLYDMDIKRPADQKHNKIKYDELAKLYKDLMAKYPLVSIEDGFAEDDVEAWSYFAKTTDVQIVGDDLTCTNPKRVQMAQDAKACNALLLKVNQIGSITEAIAATKLSYSMGWGVMTSHRSGETEDTLIADLAVGLRTGQIKSGAPCRGERLAKYNRLLRIEEELGKDAVYAGAKFRTTVNM